MRDNIYKIPVNRAALYGLFCLLALYTIWKGIIPAWKELNSDFPNYYLSARIVLEGKDISRLYEDEWFNRQLQLSGLAEQGKFSPFPPATAFILLPVANLPPLAAKRIWTVCNIFFLLAIIFLLQKVTTWDWIVCAILVLITGQALINNFRLGQLYLMVSCIIVLSHYLIQKDKSGIAGSLLGVVAIIKYFPVVFIAGYALIGNLRVAVYALATMLGLVMLQMGVFGTEIFITYVTKVLVPHLQGDLSMQSSYAVAFQSWESLLRNIFVFHPVENPQPLINNPSGKWIAQAAIYGCIAFPTLYILWQARLLQKPLRQWIYLSLPPIAALVLSPASASYHYLLLIFPFILVLKVFNNCQASIWVISWFICLYMGTGWLSYTHVQKLIEPTGWLILFFYPRLWIVFVVYLSYVWLSYRMVINGNTQVAGDKSAINRKSSN